ncbi:MAG: LysM peptidoglycan-binding domain-containing protein [Clostridia bacterium]|nr:LysM peptidoglycan-binding domain-containing protein [Clostridia bacterium]
MYCPYFSRAFSLSQNPYIERPDSNILNYIPFPQFPVTNPYAHIQNSQGICQNCIARQPSGFEPPSCPHGKYYTLQPGDTLFNIAKAQNISLKDILDANSGINPNRLFVGQSICIPLSTQPPLACQPQNPEYVIKRRDTLSTIAKIFNITVNDLKKANPGIHPYVLRIGQKICIPVAWNTFTNAQYRVSLKYPSHWHKVNETRYEGKDGFFQISAIAGNSLDKVCKNEAYHPLKPYGSKPKIIMYPYKNRTGCLILPSQDQPVDMKNQAAFIIRYPKPIVIDEQSYNYFILWADRLHIRGIVSTLEFLQN